MNLRSAAVLVTLIGAAFSAEQAARGLATFAFAATGEVERGVKPPLAATEGAPARGNILWGMPLSSLTATRERPLFRPSRRPPPVAGAALITAPSPRVAPAPDVPRLALVGTVASTNEAIAVFINETTREVMRLRTGEGFEGWILRDVGPREVVLERDRETATFSLPAVPERPQ